MIDTQGTKREDRGFATAVLVFLILAALLAAGRSAPARGGESAFEPGVLFRIEARFVDRVSDAEAGWGATGQILLPALPGDPAFQRWRQERPVATSRARQNVTVAPGERALIRVGREIPFASWFRRLAARRGWLEPGAEWREVESALEVEAWFRAADGTVQLVFVPEFSYLSGRSRCSVTFPDERTEVFLTPGTEVRITPAAAKEGFYSRLLAGYDPLRRVGPVDLVLRADLLEPTDP